MTNAEQEPPTGRELRLVNSAIRLLILLDPAWLPRGVALTYPARLKLDELDECVRLYKAYMLKPEMKRHTQIPVGIVRDHGR